MDSLQSEGEAARALREIRARDPSFDMVAFLRSLKVDVRTVIKVRAGGRGLCLCLPARLALPCVARLCTLLPAPTDSPAASSAPTAPRPPRRPTWRATRR